LPESTTLDLKGLKCPLPVLKTRKALAGLPSGHELTVMTTDPMAAIDIPHFCNESGNELLTTNIDGNDGTFVIRKT